MDTEPLVSVVRGEPAAEELAALVTILAAASSKIDAAPAAPRPSTWARSARPSMGPRSWRTSALPG
ncbi:acyl-CoA carboxylase subunit epsilon [Paractinoplanes lichenicola]|uniref:Acyl-CoA carboxylase subunit epsilon n=1 Tax=Paractinoplanes lichenicola TaxID=2802976 RepID=A0ABS1VMW8_9ACTN|nr:acyl-CoA carboxylase subunit epsilon [Actinoplanes lichenicola]MBL7254836.1 acyl-CoA carboxylase subunit epsilon [Actinoplanes lichenicola]